MSVLRNAGLTVTDSGGTELAAFVAWPNGIRVDVKWLGVISELDGYDEDGEAVWHQHDGWHADVRTEDQAVITALAAATLQPSPVSPYHKFAGD